MTDTRDPSIDPAPLPPGPASRSATLPVVAAALVALAALGVWQARSRWRASPRAGPTTVVVFPFGFTGDSTLAMLGRGMPSLLGPTLDGAGPVAVIDAAAVLPATEDTGRAPDASTADGLVAPLGTAGFIVGEVVEAGGRVRIRATYHARDAAATVTQAAVTGGVGDLFALVDRLAHQLAVDPTGSPPRPLAGRTTASLSALTAFLEGEVRQRHGPASAAARAYRRAAALDSTFALAHLRLAGVLAWSGSGREARRAAARAARFATRLTAPERGVAEGLRLLLAGEDAAAERVLRETLLTWPDASQPWGPLGLVLFRFNPLRGRPMAEARPPLERARGAGPREAITERLLELAAIAGDRPAFDSLLSDTVAGSRSALVARTVSLLASGDAVQRAALLRALRAAPDTTLVDVARHLLFLSDDAAAAGAVVQLLIDRRRPARVRVTGHILLAHLAAGAGRWRAADTALTAAGRLDRSTALEHRALLYSFPFAPIPRAQLAAARAALVRWQPPATSAGRAPHAELRAYLIGQLAVRMGDLDVALGYARTLERLAGPPDVARRASELAQGLRARVAQLRGRALAARGEIERLGVTRTPLETPGLSPYYEQPLERWLHGEILQALGRPEAALGWYGSLAAHSPFGRAFLAPAALRQAELAEALGRRAEARRQYARALTLWSRADPQLAPVIQDARRRLARLRVP